MSCGQAGFWEIQHCLNYSTVELELLHTWTCLWLSQVVKCYKSWITIDTHTKIANHNSFVPCTWPLFTSYLFYSSLNLDKHEEYYCSVSGVRYLSQKNLRKWSRNHICYQLRAFPENETYESRMQLKLVLICLCAQEGTHLNPLHIIQEPDGLCIKPTGMRGFRTH